MSSNTNFEHLIKEIIKYPYSDYLSDFSYLNHKNERYSFVYFTFYWLKQELLKKGSDFNEASKELDILLSKYTDKGFELELNKTELELFEFYEKIKDKYSFTFKIKIELKFKD